MQIVMDGKIWHIVTVEKNYSGDSIASYTLGLKAGVAGWTVTVSGAGTTNKAVGLGEIRDSIPLTGVPSAPTGAGNGNAGVGP